ADLSAKGPLRFPKMYRLSERLREHVRYGLRPESKAGLCMTMVAERGHDSYRIIPHAPAWE
ncbi:hypothetical protein C5I_0121035, partial [Pseudomonas syringae pv. syringae FF5]